MNNMEEREQRLRKVRKKLVPSLAFSLIVPWALYMILRRYFDNDTMPLAITAAVPVIRTLVLWGWRRRIDWIGVIGILSFTLALAATAVFGGSTLPIKLVHPVIFAAVGLVFLVSVLLERPLLLVIVKALKRVDEERLRIPAVRKRFTFMTALFGGVFLIGSLIHIVMALTLPTAAYLPMAKAVSWATILVLIIGGRFAAARTR